MNQPNYTIDITINDDRWVTSPLTSPQDIEKFFFEKTYTLLSFLKIECDNIELSIVLCNNSMIQKLNSDYRGKDKPTNVLSFPCEDRTMIESLLKHNQPHYVPIPLGDVVLSYDKVCEEAVNFGISAFNHLTHLFIHGLLHLLGYDHMTDGEAEEMESIEIEVLKIFGIDNPYN